MDTDLFSFNVQGEHFTYGVDEQGPYIYDLSMDLNMREDVTGSGILCHPWRDLTIYVAYWPGAYGALRVPSISVQAWSHLRTL
jgi:hypothetical protein